MCWKVKVGKMTAGNIWSTRLSTADHITLFTSQRCTLLPAYLYQKDERESNGKNLEQYIFEFI